MSAGGRWPSLALSTRASHCRQVGAIDMARELDDAALACAYDQESRADALIGLAADAVAAGDPSAAAEWHGEAAGTVADWRTRTRWHWVAAELALLQGDRISARDHALAAVAVCADMSSRHVAKSRLILAAATEDVSDLPEIARDLAEAGWITLEWPLALIAADHADRLDADWLAGAWARGVAAIDHIEVHLPDALTGPWQAHPGVRRLRGAKPGAAGE
ncbi:MAG: hypothetical protein RL347_53 [Actinomycetota bacterium]|jgi:hypothetical protein